MRYGQKGMCISDLISELEELRDAYGDLAVRIAYQSSWPLAGKIIQTEMGITGTTAKEATETISGSMAGMGSAVENLMAGLGNANADVGALIGNVVEAFQNVVKNVTPVIENIVESLPPALDGILEAVSDLLPTLLETVVDLFTQVLEMLLKLLPELIPAAVNAVLTIVDCVFSQFRATVLP